MQGQQRALVSKMILTMNTARSITSGNRNIYIQIHKNSSVMSLSRPPQTLLCVVSCRNYFLYLPQLLSYIRNTAHSKVCALFTGNSVMISGHYWWVFQMYHSTTFRAPFTPVVFEKRQKSLQPISPKLGDSYWNYLDW